jgi:hypothetical protein
MRRNIAGAGVRRPRKQIHIHSAQMVLQAELAQSSDTIGRAPHATRPHGERRAVVAYSHGIVSSVTNTVDEATWDRECY